MWVCCGGRENRWKEQVGGGSSNQVSRGGSYQGTKLCIKSCTMQVVNEIPSCEVIKTSLHHASHTKVIDVGSDWCRLNSKDGRIDEERRHSDGINVEEQYALMSPLKRDKANADMYKFGITNRPIIFALSNEIQMLCLRHSTVEALSR